MELDFFLLPIVVSIGGADDKKWKTCIDIETFDVCAANSISERYDAGKIFNLLL